MPVVVTVEDGTGVAGANSYASVEDADLYFGTRPRSAAWFALTVDEKGQHLIHATRVLDFSTTWEGQKAFKTQPLAFPRYPDDFSAAVVPDPIISAQLEVALAGIAADLTSTGDEAPLKQIEVGPIKIVSEIQISSATLPQFVRDLIAPWGRERSQANTVKLYRT